MVTFPKPQNLNGAELRIELANAGVEILDALNGIVVQGENILLDINPENQVIAAPIIAAHNGTTIIPEPTAIEKLEAAGLTVEELKKVLGIN